MQLKQARIASRSPISLAGLSRTTKRVTFVSTLNFMKFILIKPKEWIISDVQPQLPGAVLTITCNWSKEHSLQIFVLISPLLYPKWYLRHLWTLICHFHSLGDRLHRGRVAHLRICALNVCQTRFSIFSNGNIFDFQPVEKVAADPWISEGCWINAFLFSSVQRTNGTANPFYFMNLEII